MSQKQIKKRGATAVEFALTLPIVLAFFFAAFEVCRFSMLTQTVENAVFEAARRGIVPGATSNDCRIEAQRILGTLALRNASIRVSPDQITRNTERVTVTIDVPYAGNAFVPVHYFSGARVQRQLTMVRELER